MSTPQLSRRSLLRAGVAVSFGSVIGAPLLASCSSSGSAPEIGGGAITLPTYVALTAAAPDLPPIDPTGLSGFLSYPSETFAAVSSPVLTSGTPVSAMVPISIAPYLERDRNTILQVNEERLGGQVNFLQITETDYLARFNTTIAGGDLPDMMSFQVVPSYPDLLASQFADLTPYLAGDAIKEYPNLANIPSAIWGAVAVGDKFYGVPQPRNGCTGLGVYRKDLFDEIGGYPIDAEEFLTFLKELTRPEEDRWGYVSRSGSAYNLSTFLQMFGVPFRWRQNDDGTLTADLETDEYREALAFAVKAYQAGVYHPDSNGPASQMSALFDSGQAAVNADAITSLKTAWPNGLSANPDANPQALTPIAATAGGKPVVYMNALAKTFTIFKKADEDRIKELLRLADYCAAPVGSEESTLRNFGVEGETFDFDADGTPVRREDTANMGAPWGAICASPMQIFDAQYPQYTHSIYDGTKALSPSLIADPTASLYSPTQGAVGATLTQTVTDACTSIIAGRKDISNFDDVVAQWRSGGGDAMRSEYEEAMKA